MDVTFHHIYSLCVCNNIFYTFFNIISILHLWYIDPIKNPKKKQLITIFSAIGLSFCLFEMLKFKYYNFFIISSLISFLGFLMHSLGDYFNIQYSAFYFHLCLIIPNYYMLVIIKEIY